MSLKEADTVTGKWHVLDAKKSKEDLHAEIKAIASKVIADCSDKAFTRLWN